MTQSTSADKTQKNTASDYYYWDISGEKSEILKDAVVCLSDVNGGWLCNLLFNDSLVLIELVKPNCGRGNHNTDDPVHTLYTVHQIR